MKFVNLTPHAIIIRMISDAAAEPRPGDIDVPPSGKALRVPTERTASVSIQTDPNCIGSYGYVLPVELLSFGRVSGLPEADGDTVILVSLVTLMALSAAGIHRGDVYAPDTDGPAAVRYPATHERAGQIYATRQLVQMGPSDLTYTERHVLAAVPPSIGGADVDEIARRSAMDPAPCLDILETLVARECLVSVRPADGVRRFSRP